MGERNKYYRVLGDLYDTKLPDHLSHGYEFERDFRHALWQLVDRWRLRVGECIGERHGHYLLRFHDTPGGRPDEAWLPGYILEEVDPPPEPEPEYDDGAGGEIDRAFGFD